MKSEVFNEDCVHGMKRYPDNHFDLAIVDPPYGIGKNWAKDRKGKHYKHKSTYLNNSIPDAEYFNQLFRVSKNQIIWGANYYTELLPAVNSWIVWKKNRDYPTQHMAEGELAWTSFKIPLRIAEFTWNGFVTCESRSGIHPHEKPVQLYRWLLSNYGQQGISILDTHLGSGSSRIAAHEWGCNFTGFELDPDYYQAQEKRFKEHTRQLKLQF